MPITLCGPTNSKIVAETIIILEHYMGAGVLCNDGASFLFVSEPKYRSVDWLERGIESVFENFADVEGGWGSLILSWARSVEGCGVVAVGTFVGKLHKTIRRDAACGAVHDTA